MSSGQAPNEVVARAQSRVGAVLQQKWRLDQLIGLGGMAAIYAATNRYGKRAAVKILFQEYSINEKTRARFLREGYAANAVRHRGVVSILDDDVAEDGSAYLVMELLEGVTLETLWERNGKKMSAQEVVRYMDQLLDVLARAHARGIVHRDIKPENLFVTRQGMLKVLDFGIASIAADEREKKASTGSGFVVGTPAFMAPEQARARGDMIDGRTDLWAVGATMFYLLAGRFVHDATTPAEIVVKAGSEPAQPLASVGRNLPPGLCAVVDRALAFAKERRWSDATTMRGALRAAGATLGLAEMKAAAQATVDEPESDAGLAVTPEMHQLRQAADKIRADLTRLRRELGAAQQRLEAVQQERIVIVRRFREQNPPKSAEAKSAIAAFREAMMEFGQRVSEDIAFGEEFAASREQVAKLMQMREAKAHRAAVLEAARALPDEAIIFRGRMLTVGLVVAAVVFVVVPLIFALR
jgi:serine/threonine-protein kinase